MSAPQPSSSPSSYTPQNVTSGLRSSSTGNVCEMLLEKSDDLTSAQIVDPDLHSRQAGGATTNVVR
ncbi:MAG: hypothetical protein LC642_00170, partial [Verrucomicrobiaceae bacterium]|nr:hypothetical protein [Verrucomicrobiaceae bacterium]